MRARSTWSLPLSLVCGLTLGCNGAIGVGGDGQTGTSTGVAGSGGPGAAGAGGPGAAGAGGPGAAGAGGPGAAGSGAAGSTGAAGTGVVTLPGSPLQSQAVRRLANYEYLATVSDLLKIKADVPLDPDAPSSGGFRIGGPAGDNTVRTYHAAAIALAAQAMPTLGNVEACYTAAAASTVTATQTTCANTIIADLGTKASRRPMDATQTAALTNVYTTIAGKYGFKVGVQAVLEAILQSPSFLYHLETEEQAKGAGKTAVTGYSMANRLSYLLWGTMPDATLTTEAGAGRLTTAAQVLAQANRMIADPRTVAGMRNFYEQWLMVLDLPLSKVKNPVTNVDYGAMYTPTMQASLRASFDAQVDAALWGGGDAVKGLLTGTDAYVDANVAPLFGMTGVTGTAMQKMAMNTAQRSGILTHPAIMSVFATETSSHPIKRGVFFWDKFLCKPLPNPPPDVPPFKAPEPGQSLRKDFEMLTSPGTCNACHVRINPVGFLFEHYDSMGRYRTVDDNGQPVDSVATIVGTGDAMLDLSTTDAVQFASRLGMDDGNVANCMVNQLYRFAMHRHEGYDDTAPLMTLQTAFNSSGRNMKTLLSTLAQSEAFLYRLNVQ